MFCLADRTKLHSGNTEKNGINHIFPVMVVKWWMGPSVFMAIARCILVEILHHLWLKYLNRWYSLTLCNHSRCYHFHCNNLFNNIIENKIDRSADGVVTWIICIWYIITDEIFLSLMYVKKIYISADNHFIGVFCKMLKLEAI